MQSISRAIMLQQSKFNEEDVHALLFSPENNRSVM